MERRQVDFSSDQSDFTPHSDYDHLDDNFNRHNHNHNNHNHRPQSILKTSPASRDSTLSKSANDNNRDDKRRVEFAFESPSIHPSQSEPDLAHPTNNSDHHLRSGLPGEKVVLWIKPIAFSEGYTTKIADVGTLILSNYRLQVLPQKKESASDFPLTAIHHMNEIQNATGSTLFLIMRDLRRLQLIFEDQNSELSVVKQYITQHGINVSHFQNLFAFKLHNPNRNYERDFNDWRHFDPVKEYERIGITQDDPIWQISRINQDYKFSPSYPNLFVVPRGLSDDELREIGEFRSRSRIPVLSWSRPDNNISLLRSSQPLVGIFTKKCTADEKLINLVIDACINKWMYVIDARPRVNALGNQIKGAGVETGYEKIDVLFMSIDNIHQVQESWSRLSQAITSESDSISVWLQGLDNSGWMKHIINILQATNLIAEKLDHKGCSVLVHCTDGWDRTAQLCALAQLCVDPYYRTLKGFIVLIEKEWLSFGHRFMSRTFGWSVTHGYDRSKTSPIFMQWIDCVFQIIVTRSD